MSRLLALCFVTLASVGSFFAPQTAQAAESYDNCTGTISSLPAVITTQGTWCMKSDLVTQITSGIAIDIQTNNVTIDCNDFKLGNGSANPTTSAIGINATNRLNAVVRNCNIRRFSSGIAFSGIAGGGHTVEDNRFDGSTFLAIHVEGDGSTVRRNRVFDTGGSPNATFAYGIYTFYSVDIIENTVSNVSATAASNGDAYGIYTDSNPNGHIDGNRIRGLLQDGTGINYGIYNSNSTRLTLTNNQVVGIGDATSVGMQCSSTQDRTKDNVVSGFFNPLVGCGDGNGNDLTK